MANSATEVRRERRFLRPPPRLAPPFLTPMWGGFKFYPMRTVLRPFPPASAVGLAQSVLGRRHLRGGAAPRRLDARERRHLTVMASAGGAAVTGVVLLALLTGTLTLDAVTWALTVVPIGVAAAYFAFMFFGS